MKWDNTACVGEVRGGHKKAICEAIYFGCLESDGDARIAEPVPRGGLNVVVNWLRK